ncbi:hypothetical protein K1719_033532 [Acacia pycnantha]|nr:hypothetical protein K1719_033532 [Acacia pycnantha]
MGGGKLNKYNVTSHLLPITMLGVACYTLFKVAQAITSNIIMFLPRNINLEQVPELSWLSSPPLELEVESNYVENHHKGVTLYFGSTAAASPSFSSDYL